MNIDIDDLSSDIIFSRENKIFFDKVNNTIKDRITISDKPLTNYSEVTFSERWYRGLNYDKGSLDQFIEKHDSFYWYLFFDTIMDYGYLFQKDHDLASIFLNNYYEADKDRYVDFTTHLINSNLPKVFKFYEITNEVPPFRKFRSDRVDFFCKSIKSFIDKNFEKMHETFGGFLFFIQNTNIKMIKALMQLYETSDAFSKYFNTYDKIKKEDYQNFRKFWFYLIKFQEVPLNYVYKFLINFEKDEILRTALNTSNHSYYYWSKLEENRVIFNKVKMNSVKYPIFDNF